MINVTFWAILAIICRVVCASEASFRAFLTARCSVGVEPTYRAFFTCTITTYISAVPSARAVYALVPGSVGAFVAVKCVYESFFPLLTRPSPFPCLFIWMRAKPTPPCVTSVIVCIKRVKPARVAGVQEGVGLVILEKVLQAMQARDEGEEKDSPR